MIPEYDPETGILKTAARGPLSEGKHTLEITVSDRAGNRESLISHFFVNLKKGKN